MLCRRADVSANICGPTHRAKGLCVHECCLYLASGLLQRGTDQEGICGFLPADIRRTIKSAAQKSCFVCGERGAAIACQQEGCSRSFHLPCASENGCVTQFFREYKSFCSDHRPQQTVQVSPDGETTVPLFPKLFPNFWIVLRTYLSSTKKRASLSHWREEFPGSISTAMLWNSSSLMIARDQHLKTLETQLVQEETIFPSIRLLRVAKRLSALESADALLPKTGCPASCWQFCAATEAPSGSLQLM
ncbi:PHD finger protein 7-like [Struthio camelus]|uniref:PHD finger protein 7-like n=1 Tax=Struthio camelus TaxID=8801 RepID=UPI003603EA0E